MTVILTKSGAVILIWYAITRGFANYGELKIHALCQYQISKILLTSAVRNFM